LYKHYKKENLFISVTIRKFFAVAVVVVLSVVVVVVVVVVEIKLLSKISRLTAYQ